MGDGRRFDLFARLAEDHFEKDMAIVDVACGKGYLQAAMRQKGFKNITSWDKRKKTAKNRRGYRYGYFRFDCKERYDAVIAMHPDEGTDHSILYAARHQVPALVCPCCIKWDATAYFGTHKFRSWVAHLKNIAVRGGLEVQECKLKMNGKNLVLILKPTGKTRFFRQLAKRL